MTHFIRASELMRIFNEAKCESWIQDGKLTVKWTDEVSERYAGFTVPVITSRTVEVIP